MAVSSQVVPEPLDRVSEAVREVEHIIQEAVAALVDRE
jgi:hypothetical protein